MTAVAIGILALYMMNLLAFIVIVKKAERIDFLESSERALWGAVNRIGDENDSLRARIWDLEHKKEGEQNADD